MKVKYNAVCRRRSGESGSALLIALGFLALMMTVGIAFLSASLFSQKLAANSGNQVQTRVLARSAAARAAFNIMLCCDQALVNILPVVNLNAASSYDEVYCNNGGSIGTCPLDDQLKSGTDYTGTKLDYNTGTGKYTGDRSTAKWLYYYDAPQGTTPRRIIGRAAFQILPEVTTNLSLYGVMGGSQLVNDLGVIPQRFRWGRGVEELALDDSTVLSGSSGYVDRDNIPYTFDMLYSAFSDWFTTDTDMKKKWVETWFAEGRDPITREVFPVRDPSDSSGKKLLYFNRFNIGDFYYPPENRNTGDNWYDRFNWDSPESKKNSDAAVEALGKASLKSSEDDTSDTVLTSYGLPFLRRIGDKRYGFATLALLRRQIAANLNDYCDSDSIPTSDKPAAEWSVTVTDNFPSYTGNEKTLYINEVGVEIGTPVLSFVDEKLTIESLPVRLVGEVINMYDNTSGDALLDPANVELTLGLRKLSFKIALSCKYTGKVTYKVVSHGMTKTFTNNFTVDVNGGYDPENTAATANVAFAPDAAITRTIGADQSAFSSLVDGYAVGTGTPIELGSYISLPGSVNYFKDQIERAARDQVPPNGTYESHQMTDIQVGYKVLCDSGSQVEFAPALLKAKNLAAVGDADGKGLDFVRFDRTGAMTLKFKGTPAAVDTGMAGKATLFYNQGGDRKWRFADAYYLGGIEARDPRQNLNPDYTRPATSDWNLVPTLIGASAAAAASAAVGDGDDLVPSMIVAANHGSDKNLRPYKVTSGHRNRYVRPSSPRYLDASGADIFVTDVDTETATDPAWRGELAGEHVSTAYIRNSPMVSAWELGLIHRGREWQTLNLKKAGGFGGTAEIKLGEIKSSYKDWSAVGTSYAAGDGAILDFVKLGVNCRSMGKLLLKQLSADAIDKSGVTPAYSKDLIRMLFDNVRVGQTMKQFYTETAFGPDPTTPAGGTAITASDTDPIKDPFVAAVSGIAADLQLRSQFLNTAYGENGFTFGLARNANDALREELIGKTVNLLAINETTPGNIFKVLIVAQSIKDSGGVSLDVPIIRRAADGTNKTLNCRIGRFDFISNAADWRKNLYFDEITGETKALVTIERVSAADDLGDPNRNFGQLVVTNIEFL